MFVSRRKVIGVAALTAMLGLAACGGEGGSAAAISCGDTTESLVAAAKKEGAVVWYTGVPAEAAQETAAAFNEKYGFTPAVLKLPSTGLLQRYSSEAQAGKIAADVLVTVGAEKFAQGEGLKNGWVEPLKDAKLPTVDAGTFPEKFMFDAAATVSIQPWLIAYNTDLVKGADVPTTWEDLADPKNSGKLMIPDPSSSDAYIELWSLLNEKYGPELLEGIAANKPKPFDSGGSTNQALGAGEGAINVSTTGSAVAGVILAGAPVKTSQPAFTTGAEMQLLVTAQEKAPNPCAGKLLSDFLMSEDGTKVMSENGDAISVYDTAGLPAEYQTPPADAADQKADVLKLLKIG